MFRKKDKKSSRDVGKESSQEEKNDKDVSEGGVSQLQQQGRGDKRQESQDNGGGGEATAGTPDVEKKSKQLFWQKRPFKSSKKHRDGTSIVSPTSPTEQPHTLDQSLSPSEHSPTPILSKHHHHTGTPGEVESSFEVMEYSSMDLQKPGATSTKPSDTNPLLSTATPQTESNTSETGERSMTNSKTKETAPSKEDAIGGADEDRQDRQVVTSVDKDGDEVYVLTQPQTCHNIRRASQDDGDKDEATARILDDESKSVADKHEHVKRKPDHLQMSTHRDESSVAHLSTADSNDDVVREKEPGASPWQLGDNEVDEREQTLNKDHVQDNPHERIRLLERENEELMRLNYQSAEHIKILRAESDAARQVEIQTILEEASKKHQEEMKQRLAEMERVNEIKLKATIDTTTKKITSVTGKKLKQNHDEIARLKEELSLREQQRQALEKKLSQKEQDSEGKHKTTTEPPQAVSEPQKNVLSGTSVVVTTEHKDKKCVLEGELRAKDATIHEIRGEITLLKKEVNAHTNKAAEYRSALANVGKENMQLKAQLDKVTSERDDLQGKQVKLKTQLVGHKNMQADVAKFKSQASQFKEQVRVQNETFSRDIERLKNELEIQILQAQQYETDFKQEREDRRQAAGKYEEEKEQWVKDVYELNMRCADVQKLLANSEHVLETRQRDLTEQCDELNEKINLLEDQLQISDAAKRSLDEKIEVMETERKSLEKNLEITSAQKADLEERFEQLQQQHETVKAKNMSLAADKREAEKQLEEAIADTARLSDDILAKTQQVKQFKGQLQESRAKVADYEREFQTLQLQLRQRDEEDRQRAAEVFEREKNEWIREVDQIRRDFQNQLMEYERHCQTLQMQLQQRTGNGKQVKDGDELAPFRLHIRDLLRGSHQIGSGSYGSVYAIELNGVKCIAKRVQDILAGAAGQEDVGDDQRRAIQQKFRQECVLLSQIRHPNIVQFIGVCYGHDQYDLTLVMERLPIDLQKCLEKCQKDNFFIPVPIRVSILLDVTYGLLHLHNSSILHRDLTAANILLASDLRAKIADLGVSRIYERRWSQQLSKLPGTIAYMPPEALEDRPEYNLKLDVFSFGVLALFVALQVFPEFSWANVPYAIISKGERELYKRQKWISKIGDKHFLYPLIRQCLLDKSEHRPSTAEINETMKGLSTRFPRQLKQTIDMLTQLDKCGVQV